MSATRCFVASVLAVSAAAPVLLAPSEACAEWDPVMHRSDAGVEMYLWSARGIGTSTPVIPFFQVEPAPDLFLGFRFPVALTYYRQFYAGLGNLPAFSIWYSDIAGKLTWYVGGRVAGPLGLIDDGGWRYATGTAAAAMGAYDLYLWAWDTLPFGALGGIEYRFADFFVLRAGGDLMFYPDFRGRGTRFAGTRGGDFDVIFQTKVEPEFQSDIGVGGGLSVMAWVAPTWVGDYAQVLLLPYFAYDSQKTFFMRVGALLALDRPLGPAFDRGRVASIYLQLGGHL
jgi:hypothetical protein